MASFAFKLTKFSLDLLTKLIKADVRLHNAEVIRDDMAIIFVVNHFTRVETVLLPYELYKETGKTVWSLAAGNLFIGGVGRWLRSMGTVSTKDPDRDKGIISSLIAGDHPWIIFPEGGMIKDKKLIDARGMFRVFSQGKHRPPHTGAAVLALRSEYYREKLRCIARDPSDNGREQALAQFDLESFDPVEQFHTVIVPINITYFPIRAHKNPILQVARGILRKLSPRAMEELTVEGTLLAQDSDVDIVLGEPIDVRSYLEGPEFEELMVCGDEDMKALENNPKSAFNEAARGLMLRYMKEIYELTTINYDHIFATINRHMKAERFTERSYRNRIFLCAHQILELGTHPVHGLLRKGYRDIIYEDPSPKFHDFMSLCLKEGIIREEGGYYFKDFTVKRGQSDFHLIRQQELTYVIANEIEPLTDVTDIIKRVARAPRRELSRTIREFFIKEDERIFDEDYRKFYDRGESKPVEIGRPFLLTPPKIKAGIVLVHGYMAAPAEVRALADYFYTKGYAVYGVRLKGHGTSPEDLAETKWEEWYESLNRGYAIIKSLTDDIVLGGFSTGGGLALLAAGRKGSKIRAVFSINAPLQLRHFAVTLVPSIVALNTLIRRVKGSPGQWEYIDNETENEHINYTRNPVTGLRELSQAMDEMEPVLKDIRVPTLIVQGSRDPTVDPSSARLIFSQVGTSHKEMLLLERDRHGIINGEGAEDVFDRVDVFLRWAKERK